MTKIIQVLLCAVFNYCCYINEFAIDGLIHIVKYYGDTTFQYFFIPHENKNITWRSGCNL